MLKYYRSVSERIKTKDESLKYKTAPVMMAWWRQKQKNKHYFPHKPSFCPEDILY